MSSLFAIIRKKNILWHGVGISVLYGLFAYCFDRANYEVLLGIYIVLFYSFYRLNKVESISEDQLFKLSFLFRAILLFAIPNLSQDFYRFIWDGRMLLEGYNPYLFTPDSFVVNGQIPILQAQELYNGMGSLSSSHFTNYPPLNQLCFYLAALISGKSILGSVVVMRILIIAADYGTYVYGQKLLISLGVSSRQVYWYLLNPFIIIELTGNLHFEGVMVFFLIASLYYLSISKWSISATLFALSVSVKLVPLMLLPLLFKRIGFKKLTGYVVLVLGITVLGFIPFTSLELYSNYANTVGLWFQNFEFNASIYYVLRELSFHVRGYNEIAIIGKALPLIVILIIGVMTFISNNMDIKILINTMVLVFTAYLFLATTVHPWYIATLVGLSVFTTYKYPIVWSVVVFLSYSAYSNGDNKENLWIVFLEYFIVYGVLIYELYSSYQTKKEPTLTVQSR